MSEFNDLEMVPEGQGGVPLEHLITCVPGVNIATAQNGIKVIKWIHNKPPPPTAGKYFSLKYFLLTRCFYAKKLLSSANKINMYNC